MILETCNPFIKIGKKGSFMPQTGLSRNKWLVIFFLAVVISGISLPILHQWRSVAADVPIELQTLHDTLLADSSSVHGNWLRTMNPLVQDVQGDVVWNNAQQQGVMRFVDLPDPKRGMVYQLWLYDVKSPTETPISGATLQQGSGKGEWFAPIKTATPVIEPYKFELKLANDAADTNGQLLLMVQP
jgi:hypothetical protein